MPGLADPSTIAFECPNDLSLATTLYGLQLKLHLLTSEHIVLSHGFIYDNPAFWSLLTPDLMSGFKSHCRDEKSTLIIQVNQIPTTTSEDSDRLFRAWAFGEELDRHLEPSAPRILGMAQSPCTAAIKQLSPEQTGIEQYARALKFSGLEASSRDIRDLLASCRLEAKPGDRYEKFKTGLLTRLMVLRDSRSCFEDHESLQDIHALDEIVRGVVSDGGHLSRSLIEQKDRDLWWRIAPLVNQIRMSTYLSEGDGSACMTLQPRSSNQAIDKLVSEVEKCAKMPKWGVALERLNFDQIFQLRDSYLRSPLQMLADNWRTNSKNADEQHRSILEDHWRPALQDGIAAVAPNCIVDNTLSLERYARPAGALAGCATTMLRLLSNKEDPTAAAGAGGVVGGSVWIGMLAVQDILNYFRISTARKAANLVATKVIDHTTSES